MTRSMRVHGFLLPIAVLLLVQWQFLRVGKHSMGSRLFRRAQSTNRGVHLMDQPMSYSRAKELLKRELQREGLDATQFGIHSLRSGIGNSRPLVSATWRVAQ